MVFGWGICHTFLYVVEAWNKFLLNFSSFTNSECNEYLNGAHRSQQVVAFKDTIPLKNTLEA